MKNITAIIALTLALITIQSCSDANATEGIKTTPKNLISVKTIDVIHDGDVIPVNATGRVASQIESELAFTTGGYVKNFFYGEGDYVEKGSKIAELDISEIAAQFAKANSAFQKANRDLERIKTLYDENVATRELFENATTGFQIAKSDLTIAQYNLRHSTIYAPVSGVILEQYVEQYEIAAPYAPVVKFGGTSQGWIVKCGISDKDIMDIAIGDTATVALDMYENQQLTATVSAISDNADPITSLFEIELTLDTEIKLKSGFIGNVKISPSKQEQYAYVPVNAIIQATNRSASVFAITESDSVYQVAVTVPRIYNGFAVVSEGLAGVDEVVTDGVNYIEDGSYVSRIAYGKE